MFRFRGMRGPRGRVPAPLSALFLLVVLLQPIGAAEEEKPTPAPGPTEVPPDDPTFPGRVDAAIDRGLAWLVKQQGANGRWPVKHDREHTSLGEQAFVLFTLAKCGLSEKHPAVAKGLQGLPSMRGRVLMDHRSGWADAKTYAFSVLLLLEDALYGKPPKEAPKDVTRYANRPPKNPCRLPRDAQERIREIVDWLVAVQAAGAWRYPGPAAEPAVVEDTSCTQLALLALQTAARCGIEVSPDVYRKALAFLLDVQQKDGPEVENWVENPAWSPGPENRYPRFVAAGKARVRGFSYTRGGAATGAMTAAGLGSLAIVKDRLGALGALDGETSRRIDRALLDGLAWLGKSFSVEREPAGNWHYYYLYGLERIGAFLGARFIGKHEWYREGAEHLLAAQTKDGSWPAAPAGGKEVWSHRDPVMQTCFALLFLKRATPPPSRPLGPVVTGG